MVVEEIAGGKTRLERWCLPMAVATVLFNLLDGVLTLGVVSAELAVEANPLMDELLQQGPLYFMLYKVTLVSLAVWLLLRLREMALARYALAGVASVYTLLMLYHLRSAHALIVYLA